MEICEALPTDLDEIYSIEKTCFPPLEAATRESLNSRINTFKNSFYVGKINGKIVGFINGAVTDRTTICDEMFDDTTMHIKDGKYQSIFGLDVLPEFQHRGLAQQLMRHFIKNAKENGRLGLILTCKDKLIGFYEQFGYKSTGVSKSTHGNVVWYDMILQF
ncbi:hypothetical protein EIN_038210 [Entamoeba invadens IP1]|uniref:N-acetyltransferase domain-containing protein n=1 Tax=Entamoeba invadens IP1 TaxID=370355 RepID=L7FNM2_ENTIV|nr:hypothetical protein EIN_038210 [Entamoeba invadens IP1]ELP94671.1 hypothetical protein EIN_038210 [Entamoeba invadens IP1]|eukprot:XP_004261442.1 hypothetical protein EIN_038210 [Entamoeba invadens IP1]